MAQSECTRKLSIQGLYPSVVSALQIKRSKNYFRYVTSVFLKFTFYMLTFILQYSYFFRSESFQEVLQTSKQRNIIFREMCSEIGRFLLQVTGCRLQVTGHRLQVTGRRSQVAGRIKIKKQSVILAIQELPEIPKRFHEQVSLCKYLPHK